MGWSIPPNFPVNEATEQIYNLNFRESGTGIQLPQFRIKDLLSKYDRVPPEGIADSVNDELNEILNDDGEQRRSRERNVRKNVSMLRSILTEEVHFWVEELDGIAKNYPYKTILEIFIRVNSGGTKLDASDLMFAAMKELSPEIEENLEDAALLLSNGGLNFEIDTILKAILLINGRGATVDPKKFSGPEGLSLVRAIDDNWDTRYVPAFQALRDFIVVTLKLDNAKIIRSYNSLVPILIYLYSHPTSTPENKARLKAFYYKAQLFNWFSAQTDGVLEAIYNRTLKDLDGTDFPIQEILNYFSTSRNARVAFDYSVLEDHSLRFFLLHLLYVETTSTSAFDVALKNNAPHIDHIYPKSKLTKDPFDLNVTDINHIGNYRLVGATDNIRKRAELPALYFTRLKNSNIEIKRDLLLSNYAEDPSLLKMDQDSYLEFRNNRAQEIYRILAEKINYQ
jgi:hypothetical protein